MKSLLTFLGMCSVATSFGFGQYRIVANPVWNGETLVVHTVNGQYGIYATSRNDVFYYRSPQTDFVRVNMPDGRSDSSCQLRAIDSSGAVYGAWAPYVGEAEPFRWTPTGGYQLEYQKPFGTFNRSYLVNDANDSGTIIGTGMDTFNNFDLNDIIWSSSGQATVTTMTAWSISNPGDIVGFDDSTGAVLRRANGQFVHLPWTQGGGSSNYSAEEINDNGLIVGSGSASGITDDLLWNSAGQLVKRHRRPSNLRDDHFGIWTINNDGVVGMAMGSDFNHTHAYLWSLTENPTDLNTLLDPASLAMSYTLTDVVSMDNTGQMVAIAKDASGHQTQLLIQPVPEPGGLAVLALGAVGLMRRRRQK